MHERLDVEGLMPCPFCGAAGNWVKMYRIPPEIVGDEAHSAYYHVDCLSCFASGPQGEMMSEAMVRWNTTRR